MNPYVHILMGDCVEVKLLLGDGTVVTTNATVAGVETDFVSVRIPATDQVSEQVVTFDVDLNPDAIHVRSGKYFYQGEVSGAIFVPEIISRGFKPVPVAVAKRGRKAQS